MKIYLGADHAGFELKEEIKIFLQELGYDDVSDEGAYELKPDDDYPDYVSIVALQVASEPDSRGIIFGGSGQGEAIAANRKRRVRAVVYYGPIASKAAVDAEGRQGTDDLDIIRLSRRHNDSNILSLGARFIDLDQAKQAVKVWLTEEFSGTDRHIRRIKKMDGLIKDENVF